YHAMQTFHKQLGGFEFSKRLATGDSDSDFVTLFSRSDADGLPGDVRLAVWTTAEPHNVLVPASAGRFRATGSLGEQKPGLGAKSSESGGLLQVPATGDVLYLAPEQPNDLLRIAAAWSRPSLDRNVAFEPAVPISLAI